MPNFSGSEQCRYPRLVRSVPSDRPGGRPAADDRSSTRSGPAGRAHETAAHLVAAAQWGGVPLAHSSRTRRTSDDRGPDPELESLDLLERESDPTDLSGRGPGRLPETRPVTSQIPVGDGRAPRSRTDPARSSLGLGLPRSRDNGTDTMDRGRTSDRRGRYGPWETH